MIQEVFGGCSVEFFDQQRPAGSGKKRKQGLGNYKTTREPSTVADSLVASLCSDSALKAAALHFNLLNSAQFFRSLPGVSGCGKPSSGGRYASFRDGKRTRGARGKAHAKICAWRWMRMQLRGIL